MADFAGIRTRVPLDVLTLPHGVYVMDTDLNGILVTEREGERTYVIHAEPWVEPFERPLLIIPGRLTHLPVDVTHPCRLS